MKRSSLALLLLVPPLLLGGLIWLRSRPGAAKAGAQESLVTLDHWPDGKPKISARDWQEGEATLQELCTMGHDGTDFGCGTLRDTWPWEGTFVDWFPNATPSQIRRFHEGQRHGVWRTYLPDGTLTVELEYARDRLVSRKIRGASGELQAAPEHSDYLPVGAIPFKAKPRVAP